MLLYIYVHMTLLFLFRVNRSASWDCRKFICLVHLLMDEESSIVLFLLVHIAS